MGRNVAQNHVGTVLSMKTITEIHTTIRMTQVGLVMVFIKSATSNKLKS